MNLDIILKHRNKVMFFAAFWILCGHSLSFCADQWGFLNIYRPLVAYGYAGVDIFFFLSGIGIALSLKKNPSPKSFLSRRISRIYPAFWIMVTISYIVTNNPSRDYLGDVLTFSYWYPLFGNFLGGYVTFWYVSAAFAFYMLSIPYYKYCLSKYPQVATLTISVIGVVLFYMSMFCFQSTLGALKLFIIRVPIYFVGMYFGYQKGCKLHEVCSIVVALVAYFLLGGGGLLLGGRALSSLGLNFILIFFIVPGLVMSLVHFFESMESFSVGRRCNQAINYLGTLSLEIYFTHGYMIGIINQYQIKLNWFLFILLSILLSFFLKQLANLLLDGVRKFAIT